MIKSEGYKAFRSTMRIHPVGDQRQPFAVDADWIYRPRAKCWYGDGRSFPEEVCEILRDKTARRHSHWVFYPDRDTLAPYDCAACGRSVEWRENFCPSCGAIMDEEG